MYPMWKRKSLKQLPASNTHKGKPSDYVFDYVI
jgi:hypothetical protein